MEVLNQPIIDIGLNLLGYLVATLLGIVIYSAWQNRGRRTAPASVAAAVSTDTVPTPSARTAEDIQVVSLRGEPRKEPPRREETASSARPRSSHRNRIEIIRLARKMLDAGTSDQMIQHTLPISDAELALLKSAKSD